MRKFFGLALAIASLAAICIVVMPNRASAFTGADFMPGRIMDDAIFFNPGTMTINDIQTFINNKAPVCDTNGTQMHRTGQTRAAWGTANGAPPPYICLKDYRETTPAKPVEHLLCNGAVAGNKSAAEIIYYVAQSCGVNPKILLLLLQKEQSLLTDDWPWPIQYRSATGYGCPDTAPCDAEYYGFFNQVYAAARVYKYYAANPTMFNYRAGRDNFILWSPNHSCGGSNVFIQNQATAGLYIYTPYQPNAASLANLYGTGDGCSAYGNRNFWRMYYDWFGNPTGNGYEFVDAINPPATMLPNDVAGARIRIRNKSGSTWYNDGNVPSGQHAMRLANYAYATTHYANSADPAWLGTQNQIKMKESSVADGEIATFEFTFRAPMYALDRFMTAFTPVLDGANFYPYIGLSFTVSTPQPVLSYQVEQANGLTPKLPTNFSQPITYIIKNTGNVVWWGETGKMPGAASLRMLTANPFYRTSPFYDSGTWLAANQIKLPTAGRIDPGAHATFTYTMKTPSTGGQYTESFGLVLDGKAIYPPDNQLSYSVDVNDYDYSLVSNNIPDSLTPGQRYDCKIVIKNMGGATWYADGSAPPGTNPIRLMSAGYRPYALANLADTAWLGNGSQIKMTTTSVAPGQNAEFNFSLVVPYDQRDAFADFRVVIDGTALLSGVIQKYSIMPPLQASFQQQPGGIHPGTSLTNDQVATGKLILKNTSNFVWYNDTTRPPQFRGGATRLVMAYPYYHISPFYNSSDPSWLGGGSQIKMTTAKVHPGENAEFDLSWRAPMTDGTYKDRFTLVIDGYALFPDIGMELGATVN